MAQVESRVQKLLRRQSVAFLTAALLASALASLLGSQLLILLGGSGLGTCFGMVFGSLSDASAVQRIRELLEDSLHTALHASEAELEPFRKVWHHYLLTQLDGKFVWRYRTFDFSRVQVPGKLVGAFEVRGRDNRQHAYRLEAHLAAPRLLFVQRAASGTEPPVVHLYPAATEEFRSQHAGLAFLKSWDGHDLCTPALMCDTPLDLGVAVAQEGTLPETTFQKLDELWGRQAARIGLSVASRSKRL